MLVTTTFSPAEIIEAQRSLAQDRHDLLGSIIRGAIRKMSNEQIEEIRHKLQIHGSTWVLARIDNVDESFFYDTNQKIMIFDGIFRAIRQIRPFNMINASGYNVQIRIKELDKFLPIERRL